jgi:signal transduction histidine kinase/CRP-like cAMP-binding protein
MKRYFSLLVIIIFSTTTRQSAHSQMSEDFRERDSLKLYVQSSFANSTVDTSTVRALTRLAILTLPAHLEESLEYALKATHTAEKLRDKHGLAEAQSAVGTTYRLSDRYDSALATFNRTYTLFGELRDSNACAETLCNIGNTHQSRGEYARALEEYFRALALYEAQHNKHGIALASANIGMAYMLIGQFATAHKYHERALALRMEKQETVAMAYSLYFLGNLHQAEQHYDSAHLFYNRGLELFESNRVAHGVALTLGELGRVYLAERRYDEAQTTLLNAYLRFQDLADKRSAARALTALATARNNIRKPIEAIDNALQALSIAEEIGALREKRDACQALSEAHDSLGHTSETLFWLRRFLRLNDSLFNNDGTQRIAALQLEYAAEQKNEEIRHLQAQQLAEEAQARTTRNGLLLGISGLAIALFAVVNRYRLKRRSEYTLRETNTRIIAQGRELEAQNEELKKLNAEKNEFLGIAAHDLRNPLANIVTVGSLMREELETHERSTTKEGESALPSLRWGIARIESSTTRMLALIEKLLDVNAIERGTANLHLETLDVSAIARASLERFQTAAAAKNITLRLSVESMVTAFADHNYTEQVLDNLISNAIKYSPEGKDVLVRVRQEKGSREMIPNKAQHHGEPALRGASRIRLEVHDEGPGLSDKDKAKLFGTFMRLSALPTGGEQSIGLGLSIVKKLVEAMNGKVWCESEHGKGATFIVELPQELSALRDD